MLAIVALQLVAVLAAGRQEQIRRRAARLVIVASREPTDVALTALVSAEAALVKRVSMPIGSSLLVVARKT